MNQITAINAVARPAHFADIPGVVALGEKCLEQSGFTGAEIVRQAAEEFLISVIERQKPKPNIFDLAAFVTGPKGEPTGVIVGVVQPIYMVLSAIGVSEIMWFVDRDNAQPNEGVALLHALHSWADAIEDGPVLRVHSTNAITGADRATSWLLRREGYTKMGEVFWKGAAQ